MYRKKSLLRSMVLRLAGFAAVVELLAAQCAAGETAQLNRLLDQVGNSVELFWQQFPAVSCIETVTQEKLGDRGKPVYRQDTDFDYLIFFDRDGDDLLIDESRVVKKEAGKRKEIPLLMTNGFSSLALIFHPAYQSSFEYQLMDDDMVAGKRLIRIDYRHIPGTRSTAALRLRGRDYPLDLRGTAWIDPATFEIVKMTAGLGSPMVDLNLKMLNSEVSYAPMRFENIKRTLWLPVSASVDVETARQHWRNIHKFNDYRHMSVKSESVVSK